MKHIVKTCSLITLIAAIPGAFAATSRVGMVANPASRLPSIAGYVAAGNVIRTVSSTGTKTSSAVSYYDNTECIDKYTDCIKADDVCGSDMSECTTNVLFHGQMSNCLSVLYQCQSSGVNALFGTTAINALSTVYSTNKDGEVTRYTYPTDGSVLGQLIIGASISNKLSTEQCVKSYTRCLHRGDVCGEDFELCTSDREFKKQALLCDSTLQRCQADGKTQLFGSVANADSLKPSGENVRLKTLIEEGAQLAALNAVKTCQKVTDNCLISACTKNPWRCVEGTPMATIYTADFVTGGDELKGETSTTQNLRSMSEYTDNYLESLTGSDIRKMLKAQCLETIGTNKYCHMTYREKSPSNKDLIDIDLQEDVFSMAYAARKDAVNTKIQEELKKFDKKTKDKCINTVKSCAMRSCGGGLGSVCYKRSKNGQGGTVTINGSKTYDEIYSGCAAIVDADANCQYAATSSDSGYVYQYSDATTFTTLFPKYEEQPESDPIGAVATLNSLLATSYNDAAIEQMKKQCQTVALSCVKSMCGTDYINCYRNRTDIVSGTYDTGKGRFDRSMNKMGGVLDYNIVMGLCVNTVKNSSVCDEHLRIATADVRYAVDNDSWGDANSVRESWWDANTTRQSTRVDYNDVIIGCAITAEDAAGKDNCVIGDRADPINGQCSGVMDDDGCIYSEPITMAKGEYVLENGAKSLFQTLLMDVEKEAQAKYNAKLTKEQNVCLGANNGGIMGSSDNGSTFMWVKLKNNKIPKNYQMAGLKPKEFMASNDLYGSFCRLRVNVTSDDADIREVLGDKAIAYFAVGDTFTCGSWIDKATLEKVTNLVRERAEKEAGKGTAREKATLAWSTVGGFLAGGLGGYFGMDALQKKGNSLGGLLDNSGVQNESYQKSCETNITNAKSTLATVGSKPTDSENIDAYNQALRYAESAKTNARNAGADVSAIVFPAASYTAGTAGTAATYAWDEGNIQTAISILLTDKKNAAAAAAADGAQDPLKTACNNVSSQLQGLINNLQAPSPSGTEANYYETKRQNIWLENNTCTATKDTRSISGSLVTGSAGVAAGAATVNYNKSEFDTQLSALAKICAGIETGLDREKQRNANLISGAALSAVGAALGAGISKTVLDVKYQKAGDAAVQAWLDEVGEHIQCFIGGEEAGSYGTVIQYEID